MDLLILTTSTTTKILTVSDAPEESDAFEYIPNYEEWIEVFVTKGKEKETATSGNHR